MQLGAKLGVEKDVGPGGAGLQAPSQQAQS